MIRIEIPSREGIELHHAVFDINGTLAIDGLPLPGVAERLKQLSAHLQLYALTAATHGNMQEIQQALNIPLRIISHGKEKQAYVQQLNSAHVITFGNGVNDVGMLRVAAIGVAILGVEGMAVQVLQAADVITFSIFDAIDLVLKPKRLIATLRE